VELRRQSSWNGQRIGELDISRKTVLLLVKRKNKLLEPKEDLTLREGDRILLYTRHHLTDSDSIYV
jgi:voltage-gated potassium channel